MVRRGAVLKARRVRLRPEPRPVGPGAPASWPPDAPGAPAGDGIRIDVIRDGDVVEGLRVACACGRRTEVECLYDAAATAGPDASGGEGK